uniref:Uncharacterized protein n=1 Tax=Oncorhynchus mykiss TaxID=8022 RepID=A0A8L0DVY3_ONCMY
MTERSREDIYIRPILSFTTLVIFQGGDITEQEAPVFFPESLYRRIELADVKTRILTFHVLICFSIAVLTQRYIDGIIEPYSAVTWDKKKLDDFLNILEGQFENLKSCVSPAKKPERRLKRYFKKLNRKVLRKMVSLFSDGNVFNTSDQININ